jgi:hypothetical protein
MRAFCAVNGHQNSGTIVAALQADDGEKARVSLRP